MANATFDPAALLATTVNEAMETAGRLGLTLSINVSNFKGRTYAVVMVTNPDGSNADKAQKLVRLMGNLSKRLIPFPDEAPRWLLEAKTSSEHFEGVEYHCYVSEEPDIAPVNPVTNFYEQG